MNFFFLVVLKPVNQYNITDRIKEANQELFETPKPETPTSCQRKVQFRKILEDYEDGGDNLSIFSVDSNTETVQDKLKHEFNDLPKEPIPIPAIIETNESSDIEEICEEVIELDLEKLDSVPSAQIIKQQLDEKEPDQYQRNPEVFNEVLLNSRQNSIEKLSESSSDDDLSVIVASYIENKNPSTEANDNSKSQSTHKKFSFRRKKKTLKLNNSNDSKSTTYEPNTNDDLKFNYKICCEYRNAIDEGGTEKLPKYTGYLSEYGLSKEQWEDREKQLEKRKKLVLEHNLKASESEIQKMDDNERAFTRWLKNKMRFPVNKTRNMFDLKSKPKKSKKK